ncbi:four helix bundle protein [Psychroserpens damuponensis]|uniref:four helix bundle protein n=1 Tax=Psychroserpens damuponensis TaxID=943936 RepID=UPI0005902592|nr:four helix bundle protein [Psychroserpens damuponensis]
MKNYTELEVWKYSRKLVKSVYQLTSDFPNSELYALTSQINRCVISVPSNIAEGIGRQTNKDTIHFLHISRGSLFELETQLFLSLDLNYITQSQFEIIFEDITSCKKLLNGFINYYKNKN